MKKIFLTPEEKKLSGADIGRKYNVSSATGARAKKSGWLISDYNKPHYSVTDAIGKKGLVEVSDSDRKLSSRELRIKFGVSLNTALRIKERGWFQNKYHERPVKMDREWAQKNISEITECAEKGVFACLRRRSGVTGKTVKDLCFPFDPEDFVQEAILRLLELSAHERRDSRAWRISRAFKIALNCLKRTKSSSLIRVDSTDDEEEENPYRTDKILSHAFFPPDMDLRSARSSLSGVIPEDVLATAEKVISGFRLSKQEQNALEQFRRGWSWLKN